MEAKFSTQSSPQALQSRLLNCLETILELEGSLEGFDFDTVLGDEFEQLRSFMENIDDVELDENDVLRIEKATVRFLEELRETIGRALNNNSRTLQ
jgi:hypothetical protein